MTSFPSVSNTYDADNVDEVIADLEQELADEQTLADSLSSSTTQEKLDEAKAFLEANKDKIATQQARLQTLDSELRQIVTSNKAKVATAAEYDALVNSADYVALADKLLSIKTLAKGLNTFLVDAGVRGRS